MKNDPQFKAKVNALQRARDAAARAPVRGGGGGGYAGDYGASPQEFAKKWAEDMQEMQQKFEQMQAQAKEQMAADNARFQTAKEQGLNATSTTADSVLSQLDALDKQSTSQSTRNESPPQTSAAQAQLNAINSGLNDLLGGIDITDPGATQSLIDSTPPVGNPDLQKTLLDPEAYDALPPDSLLPPDGSPLDDVGVSAGGSVENASLANETDVADSAQQAEDNQAFAAQGQETGKSSSMSDPAQDETLAANKDDASMSQEVSPETGVTNNEENSQLAAAESQQSADNQALAAQDQETESGSQMSAPAQDETANANLADVSENDPADQSIAQNSGNDPLNSEDATGSFSQNGTPAENNSADPAGDTNASESLATNSLEPAGADEQRVDVKSLPPPEQTAINTEADARFYTEVPEMDGKKIDPTTNPEQAERWMEIQQDVAQGRPSVVPSSAEVTEGSPPPPGFMDYLDRRDAQAAQPADLMPVVRDASNAAYDVDTLKPGTRVGDYLAVEVINDTDSKLGAVVMDNPLTNTRMVSIRGTDGAMDMANNVGLVSSWTPKEFDQADQLVNNARANLPEGYSMLVTGHSQGGAVASLLGTKHDIPAVSLNQGPSSSYKNEQYGNAMATASQYDLRSEYEAPLGITVKDPVSSLENLGPYVNDKAANIGLPINVAPHTRTVPISVPVTYSGDWSAHKLDNFDHVKSSSPILPPSLVHQRIDLDKLMQNSTPATIQIQPYRPEPMVEARDLDAAPRWVPRQANPVSAPPASANAMQFPDVSRVLESTAVPRAVLQSIPEPLQPKTVQRINQASTVLEVGSELHKLNTALHNPALSRPEQGAAVMRSLPTMVDLAPVVGPVIKPTVQAAVDVMESGLIVVPMSYSRSERLLKEYGLD